MMFFKLIFIIDNLPILLYLWENDEQEDRGGDDDQKIDNLWWKIEKEGLRLYFIEGSS